MKTITKFALITIIAGLGFYNLQIDKKTDFGMNFTLVENSASADSEEVGGSKVAVKHEESGTNVVTIMSSGGLCTVTTPYRTVSCIGSGSISCTPSHTLGTQTTTC